MKPNYMNDTIRKFQRREKWKAFRRSAWNDVLAAFLLLVIVLVLIAFFLAAWDRAVIVSHVVSGTVLQRSGAMGTSLLSTGIEAL